MLLPAGTLAQNLSAIGCCDPLPEFRDGTATLAQVQEWVARTWTGGYFKGESPGPAPAPIDLDQDGVADLLSEIPGGGSGGPMYLAFLSTPSGYRYVGSFQGRIVPVSRTTGELPRMVTRSRNGGACMELQLRELRPDGMHRVAQSSLRTGSDDRARAEYDRLLDAIFGVPVAPASVVRQVFAARTMKALLINVMAQLPELTQADEGYEICGTAKVEYQASGASPNNLPHLAISITTHDSIEEASREIETSIHRSASGTPPRQETMNGQILYVWDADTNHRTTILARVDTRVIGVNSQQQLAALAMKSMGVLLPQVEAADGK